MTSTSKPSIVALIPARAGSKRIPGKNIKPLGGKPLIAWTIDAAIQSGVFSDICVVTDSGEISATAIRCAGDRIRVMARSDATAADDSPDIAWVREFFEHHRGGDAFSILRPTSPFRTAATIRRAVDHFEHSNVHSIRAVQPVKEHPGKMWQVVGNRMFPLIGKEWPPHEPGYYPLLTRESRPWHSSPTQTLPIVHVQNASLEIAWAYVLQAFDTISGTLVAPFFTEGLEGFDINTPEDWTEAEYHMAERHHPIEYLG